MNEFLNRHATRLGLLCLVLAACLLLAQHWGMWLSNSDDASILQHSLAEVYKGATEQGRFWLIPIYLMAQMPYKLGSWALANAKRYWSMVLSW